MITYTKNDLLINHAFILHKNPVSIPAKYKIRQKDLNNYLKKYNNVTFNNGKYYITYFGRYLEIIPNDDDALNKQIIQNAYKDPKLGFKSADKLYKTLKRK